ncbi:hypothetical protein SLEP1_g707 [Rubroshorea leprosula]|uniref:Uncharacterized protein n=1 Tax=Rubroshorea leprosula TaxID=152421 RepID=A0AAV5HK65_9ROSI|nr:hypothetical protein SLEP1_g707 [Rubroshorea leprosula]
MATAKVATFTHQPSFMGILFLVLIFTTGLTSALQAPTCLGPCSAVSNCQASCVAKGFPNGGVCAGFLGSGLACCCF